MNKKIFTILFACTFAVLSGYANPIAVCDTSEVIPFYGGAGSGMGGG